MAAEHTIEVLTKTGDTVAFLDNATDRQWNRLLNRGSTFDFTLDLNDPVVSDAVLAGGQNYINYYRNNVLTWAGEIVLVEDTLRGNEEKVHVQCYDWFNLLRDRRALTTLTYTSMNEGLVLQSLINEVQGVVYGDMGIILGSNSAATTIAEIVYERVNIQQAFIDMSEQENGVDYEITPERVLNIYETKGNDLTASHVFEYGQNIYSFRRARDWRSLKNDIRGIGRDGIERSADDIGSQSTYRRRQSIESFTDDLLYATLDKHLSEVLRKNAVAIRDYSMDVLPESSPEFGTYAVGDTVQVNVQKGYVSVNQAMRIYGWNVSIDNDGVENVQLIVNPVL